tara:strand:+ start:891 stop:1016 length:126 start_codon:yes stop_codon:yes gene_type:complete
MIEFATFSWGFVLSHVIAFTSGALIGRAAWEWVRGFFPWNR